MEDQNQTKAMELSNAQSENWNHILNRSKSKFIIWSCLATKMIFSILAWDADAANKCDISYLWHPNAWAVAEYKKDIRRVLWDTVGKKLVLVKWTKNYWLIWNRNANCRHAENLARAHSIKLQHFKMWKAASIADNWNYGPVFNISFWSWRNLDALKKDFKTVYDTLGNWIWKNLFIEEVSPWFYSLVYKHRWNRQNSVKRARQLDKQLRSKWIDAWIKQEVWNPLVFGESTYLHTTLSPHKTYRKAEKKRKVKNKPRVEIRRNNTKPKKNWAENLSWSGLEQIIESIVKREKGRGGVLKHYMKTSWKVYDFSTWRTLASINEDVEMQAASMIKIFVALAFFHEVEYWRLVHWTKSRRMMKAMLQKSSNKATNWFIDQMWWPNKVERILKQNYPWIFKNTRIVEKIPDNKYKSNYWQTYRNKASAHDYSRFLYALWNWQLPNSDKILYYMNLPWRDRLYSDASKVPKWTARYNKTWSTAKLIWDVWILVWRWRNWEQYPYIIVWIIQSDPWEHYNRFKIKAWNVIRKVSSATYAYLKRKVHRNLR